MLMVARFNKEQINRISEISGNASLVFFASMVLPGLVKLPTANMTEVSVGTLLSFVCIYASINLLKRKKI